MSGVAESANVTFSDPSQSIWLTLICLFEFVTPIFVPPNLFWRAYPLCHNMSKKRKGEPKNQRSFQLGRLNFPFGKRGLKNVDGKL